MSPKAILRRQCIRAMRQLLKHSGYSEEQFEIPTRADNDHDVLPGTPMYWWKCSHEYDEYDCKTALEQLHYERSMSYIDWSRMAEEDRLRDRYREMRLHPEGFWVGAVNSETFDEYLAKEWGSTVQFCEAVTGSQEAK